MRETRSWLRFVLAIGVMVSASVVLVLVGPVAVQANQLTEGSGSGAETVEQPRWLQLRIRENDALLFSTWSGEQGQLQATPARGPINTTLSSIPPFFRSVRDVLVAVPTADHVLIRNVSLPQADHEVVSLDMEYALAVEGTLPAEIAAKRENLTTGEYLFGGVIPIEVVADGAGLRYKLLVSEGFRVPVPRTSGLFLEAESAPHGQMAFRLDAPEGAFESEGCEPVPGTKVPPGYYVLQHAGREARAAVYANTLEYALQGRLVELELTIIPEVTEE